DYDDDYDDNYASSSYEPEEIDCTLCGGTGKSLCNWCNGTGTREAAGVEYKCSCGGDGYTDCVRCFGTGKIKNSNAGSGGSTGNGGAITGGITPPIDDYNNNFQSTCAKCNGAGTVTCFSCHGTGKLAGTHYAPNYGGGSEHAYNTYTTCAACRGSGRAPCTLCGGNGLY
ncbi:MAG: hypothetical protein ACI4I4_02165, partial [Acutalibacteraceae bacterium]